MMIPALPRPVDNNQRLERKAFVRTLQMTIQVSNYLIQMKAIVIYLLYSDGSTIDFITFSEKASPEKKIITMIITMIIIIIISVIIIIGNMYKALYTCNIHASFDGRAIGSPYNNRLRGGSYLHPPIYKASTQ